MAKHSINPNSDKDFIDKLDLENEHSFPKFLKSIELSPFRHINDLKINFIHPISAISGTNRSGKSTVLMAIACSHFDFKKRNVTNGILERQTWSSIMQFTSQDRQLRDWTYFITYKFGRKEERKRGQRKNSTKKWNGIGKKESQFKDRQVVFIDLDRISPARNFGKVIFIKAQKSIGTKISTLNVRRIEECLSYVLEEEFKLNKLAEHLDKDIFKYINTNEYSSYNAATGEEVLTKLIIDIIEAPANSLILIDEIEIGLHPKIQRRLIQAIYNISRNDNKQFILTTHSPTILSALPEKARIFIERDSKNNFKAIPNISVNAALSKMDSESYPLLDIFCEDKESEKIIFKAISSIQEEHSLQNFSNLINIIVSGSADQTYGYFIAHRETYQSKRIKTGYACVLDGDMKNRKNSNRINSFPEEENLHFLYSEFCPEKFLVTEYVNLYPQSALSYHLKNSDSHCLFEKMIENSICLSRHEAFEICWDIFKNTPHGSEYFESLKRFIIDMAKKYSPDL